MMGRAAVVAGLTPMIQKRRYQVERRRRDRPLVRRWNVVVVIGLWASFLAGCALPQFGGPDWHQRRLILVPGVCMDATNLPKPPGLPPGLPLLPSKVQLPTFLSCGPDDTDVSARERALETFATLITALGHAPRGQQAFHTGDLRFYSFNAKTLASYTPSETRQSLETSAAALESEFRQWHQREPQATFDVVAHSLGGSIVLLWAAQYALHDDLRFVHAIVTLDSPALGYPRPLFDLVEPYIVPLYGNVARELVANSSPMRRIAQAPAKWQSGPGKYANAVFNIGNIRDLVVPAFIATLSGADGAIDDFGLGPDDLNHGAVLRGVSAVASTAAVLQTAESPKLAQ